MATSETKYTRVNFDQIVTDLTQILKAKEGALSDLGESSYGRTLIELFAANADLMATWAESSFENSFLETAFTREAAYVGARSIGYSIRRTVPAKAGFGISLRRTGIYPTVRVVVPKGVTFSAAGVTITTMEDSEFLYDRTQLDFQDGLMKLVSGSAVAAEGLFGTQQFFSNGTQNQEFIMSDLNFSDWFGINDPNFDETQSASLRKNAFTTITTDSSLVSNSTPEFSETGFVWWRISRRGFQDPTLKITTNRVTSASTMSSSSTNVSNNYTAVINTANDGRAKIQFSDGINAAIPYGTITVKYFSTLGEQGNRLNVAGSLMNPTGTNIIITQSDGSESDLGIADLNFGLTTDIMGGLNIESIESIKQNAPQIFNSLDSLGNRTSYNTFLRRVADIRYSNAYGEDVLARVSPNYRTNLKYSNIVRFSVLKDLYRLREGKYYPTDPFEYYVDGYKVNGLTYLWQYDYTNLPTPQQVDILNTQLLNIRSQMESTGILIKIPSTSVEGEYETLPYNDFFATYLLPQAPIPIKPLAVFNANLTPLDFVVPGSELDSIIRALNRRGYLTLGGGQTMYDPPIIHDMSADITVILYEGQTFGDVKQKIKNAIYTYLRENTEFSMPIYRSALECIIQDFSEVAGVNLAFKPKANQYIGFSIADLLWLGNNTSQLINQTGIDFNGFQISLSCNTVFNPAVFKITFDIGNQQQIQSQILNYYKSFIQYTNPKTGAVTIRPDLTEEMLNQFTTFIWVTMLNQVYDSLYNKYLDARAGGDIYTMNATYEVMNAIKNWYFNGTSLAFTDTPTIRNMIETGNNSMFNYFVYALEYIKLVRNILGYNTTNRLIDVDGNVSLYSNNNEIVQFNIGNEDIKIEVRTR